MTHTQIEHAAYIAAHQILAADLTNRELACPGARRSAAVDNVAAIIRNVYESFPQKDIKETANARTNQPYEPYYDQPYELYYTGI